MSPTQTKVCSVRPIPIAQSKPVRTKTNTRQPHPHSSTHQDRRPHRPRNDTRNRHNKHASRVHKPSPASSRSSTPVPQIQQAVTRETSNKLQSIPRKTEYVFVHPAPDNMKPVTTFDTASCIVSDQKIKSTYEKPRERNGTTIYGKFTTKVVTITVTTTIATTEITHPDEGAAYIAALERQMAGCGTQKPETMTAETVFQNSKKEATADRDLHERFHRQHHLQATPSALPKQTKVEP